jgi:hypothetical protein
MPTSSKRRRVTAKEKKNPQARDSWAAVAKGKQPRYKQD